jgi:hypothetical protein
VRNGEVIHPGADIELLARWHDGELAPGERAHFEAHRAHCSPCRNAAEEYTQALAFYRGTRISRAPRGLSSRILRRIQPAGARRPPVGIVHGIDLRWAAAVVLAIVVGLLGQGRGERPLETATPIRLVTPILEVSLADGPDPRFSEDAASVEPAPAAPRPSRSTRVPEARPVYPAPAVLAASPLPAPAAPVAPPPPRQMRQAPQARAVAAAAPSARRSAERFGGEGAGGDAAAAFVEPARPEEPLEVRITSADAAGWPPGVLNAESIRLPAEQRGLRYIVMLDAQGIVRAVETVLPAGSRAGRVLGVVAPAEIWKLRFESGRGPRRLLLKID